MSLTKAQQKMYQKAKEQKNKAPAGATAESKAKSKADSQAHVCQVRENVNKNVDDCHLHGCMHA